MSYSIETRTVSEFVTDNTIKLPRFQRKSTWKPSQDFELAISMFKEYPLGVVVLNDEHGTSWLLDGRQRRNALKSLRDNPDDVYDAARNYIKFSPSEPVDELKAKYWQKVGAYLINYASMSDEEKNNIEYTNDDEECAEEEFGIDRLRQQVGLKTLLDIILMVHPKKKDKESGMKYGAWERLFKLDSYLTNLPYAPKRNNYKIIPEELHAFILSISQKAEEEHRQLTIDFFIEFLEERIREGKESEFRSHIETIWDDIKGIIEIVRLSEVIFRRARIGVISIKNVTPLDAQNIFSRINSGGTPLTPEELISAKPFWNEPIHNPKNEVVELAKKMYRKLDIPISDDGPIVKWDFAATLMGRIKDNKLLFENYTYSEIDGSKNQTFPELNLGFRLLAGWFMKGVSKVHINSLEQNKSVKWPDDVDDFVEDFNRMINIIRQDNFFQTLNLWQRPMMKLIGASATFEFCTIAFDYWKKLDEPAFAGNKINQFYRGIRALFDNLVFEYATGSWKGSGDSKMSRHLKAPHDRMNRLDSQIWQSFISDLCTTGKYNGQHISRANIEPLIYYQMILRGQCYPFDTPYEIDHIIPQALLKGHSDIPDWFMDSAINLSLLPMTDNNTKSSRLLKDFKGTPLAHTISQFTGIDENDFEKYSILYNYKDLIDQRKELWLSVFKEKRETILIQ